MSRLDFYMVVTEDGSGAFFVGPEFFDELDEAKNAANEMSEDRRAGHSVEIYECQHKLTV